MKKLINNSMLKLSGITGRFLLCLIILLPAYLNGQNTAPVWLDSEVRDAMYPQESYYTGYAEIEVNDKVSHDNALGMASKKAVGELSERIRVMVTTQQTLERENYSGTDIEEQIYSKFSSMVQTTSQNEVVGSKVSTYYDATKQIVYAFASVSKEDLKQYYAAQISLCITQIEGALTTADELSEKGYKMRARSQCLAVVDAFATIAYAQDLLTVIEGQTSQETTQQIRCEKLRNRLVQTLTDLENSTYIYLDCTEVVNGEYIAYIADRLPGMLFEQGCGCNFTEYEEEADYVVKVNARLSRLQDAPNKIVFCYATATVSVTNTHTQKVLKPRIEETKGSGIQGNYAAATEEAFEELAVQIAEQVGPLIKN